MKFARFGISLSLAAAAMALSVACFSSTAATADPGAGTTTTTMSTSDAGSSIGSPDETPFLAGQALVASNGCPGCHGADLSGNLKQSSGVYSANITPDMDTGIGSWTLINLMSALRQDVDDQGQPVCSTMPVFPELSDTDIVDIYAYLQGIPAVSKAQTDTDCMGNPSGDDDDDGGTDDDDAGALDAAPDATGDAAPDSGGPDASDPCPHKVCVAGAALATSWRRLRVCRLRARSVLL